MEINKLDGLKFKGKFRSYQQKVLDNSEKYLSDGNIHIVAAPGSGKTILGLELLIRLGKPTLILSPTIVISRQWGERFSEMYLPEGKSQEEFVSFDLKNPQVITSVTYQTLHYAVKKQWEKEDDDFADDENSLNENQDLDFSSFDLLEFINTYKIGTICLDEAHHLRREWERTLEGFIEMLPQEIKIISLTATPPYDSSSSEWNRYIKINGSIDEEIFVPELVSHGTLCPHQDYIYFNEPTPEEYSRIGEYRSRADACARELLSSSILIEAVETAFLSLEKNALSFFQHGSENTALAIIANHNGKEIPSKIKKILSSGENPPKVELMILEKAVNHILLHPEMFSEQICNELKEICSKYRVLSHGKLVLRSSDKIDKLLVSSMGKLESISKIADAEHKNLKDNLRMCILTDYIRKEHVNFIGSSERISTMGVVPIFESLRRSLSNEAKIGVLTGSLIIWPSSGIAELTEISKNYGMNLSSSQIGSTNYHEVTFDGGNRNKVLAVSEAFSRGEIQILVGTAALLGEGWDSPCINSMILASYVGSYVLSNQMRGRAIRSFAEDSNKTANIWHLATLAPNATDIALLPNSAIQALPENITDKDEQLSKTSMENKEPDSMDYKTLKRRFECFYGPDYDGHEIRSGIDRINIIKGPYDKNQVANINRQMLARASERDIMADTWKEKVFEGAIIEIEDVNAVPRIAHSSKGFRIRRTISPIVTGLLAIYFLRLLILSVISATVGNILFFVLISVLTVALFTITVYFISKLKDILSPIGTLKKLSKSLLFTMKQLSIIRSDDVGINVSADNHTKTVTCSLTGGTTREKGLFSKAIGEMLSPMENPRYIAVRKSLFHRGYNFFQSYACPTFISNSKSAKLFEKQLRKHLGHFAVEYTKNEIGYWLLTACRNVSFVNVLSGKGKGLTRFFRALKKNRA